MASLLTHDVIAAHPLPASTATSHSPDGAGPAPGPRSSPGWIRPLSRRPLFLQLPVLLRGTADDDTPCPGYLFEEIASILRGDREGQGTGVPREREGIPGQGELPGAAPGRGGCRRPAGLVGGSRGVVGTGWDPVEGLNSWQSGSCCCPPIPAGSLTRP